MQGHWLQGAFSRVVRRQTPPLEYLRPGPWSVRWKPALCLVLIKEMNTSLMQADVWSVGSGSGSWPWRKQRNTQVPPVRMTVSLQASLLCCVWEQRCRGLLRWEAGRPSTVKYCVWGKCLCIYRLVKEEGLESGQSGDGGTLQGTMLTGDRRQVKLPTVGFRVHAQEKARYMRACSR